MANTSITIYPQYNSNQVTSINCGTSLPKLSGSVNLTYFPNLTSFTCISNDIISLSGYNENSNLKILKCNDNKITGNIPSLSSNIKLVSFHVQNNNLIGNIPNLNANNELVEFYCHNNNITGPIPNLNNNPQLKYFLCSVNELTGVIPSLSGLPNLLTLSCDTNFLSGPIPNLSNNILLSNFFCHTNSLTGSIPSLDNNVNLNRFHCGYNQLSGNIPDLTANINLLSFYCHYNSLSGYNAGGISINTGTFNAQNNQLTTSAVDLILHAFWAANRTSGTKILYIGGSGNAAPSYTGGVTTTSIGSNFTKSGTLVTANVTNHNHTSGNIVTITGITPTAFQGTFTVTVNGPNQFQYNTISSGTATGAGTVRMRRTTNNSDGYASYQNLALVSRVGGPWDIQINQP